MTRQQMLAKCGLFTLALMASTATAQEFSWSEADAERLASAVEAGEFGRVTSVWIEQDGELVYEAYFNGADASTTHNMRSVGKTITGMLLGAAIDDGLLAGVDARAAGFFDDLRPFENDDERKNDISVEDLLTMSSGLECDDWNSFSRGNEERMYLIEDWSAFFWDLPMKNHPSWEIPEDDGGFDRLFDYCTAGVQLVGEIVERVAGEPVPEYAARRLFGPIGLQHPTWNHASSGKAHLGGGLELTTADWARLARLYVSRGRHKGKQILPESWIDASFTDYVKIDDTTNYGYLWWRRGYDVAGTTYIANFMSGYGGNRVFVLPEFGVVAVLSKSDFRDPEAHAKSDRFFAEEIAARLRPPTVGAGHAANCRSGPCPRMSPCRNYVRLIRG